MHIPHVLKALLLTKYLMTVFFLSVATAILVTPNFFYRQVQNLDLGIGDCAFKCRLMCPRCLHKSNERTPIWGRVAHPRTIPAIHRSIEGFDQLIKYFDHNRRLKRLKNYFRCLISRFSRFGGRLFTVFLRPGHKSHRVPLPGAK